MYEQYGMGQYPFPWGGVTPPPNWQPQTPPMQQSQQGIQGVRFVSGIEEAKNCTIPLGSKALLMDKEKDRFYLKETDITGVSTVSEFEFKKVEAEAPQEYVTRQEFERIICDGSNITINRCGVYEVLANFTYAATVAGVQETQMFRNGNAVPGAHALDTVATVGDNVSQAFHAIVTVPKNAPTATLNFKSANATSVRVANVIVVKVA